MFRLGQQRSGLAALLLFCIGCEKEKAGPVPLPAFSAGRQMLVLEESSRQLFAFDVLGEQGNLNAKAFDLEKRRPTGAQCLTQEGKIVSSGDCSAEGWLFVCTSKGDAAEGWSLSRFKLSAGIPALDAQADVAADCSQLRVLTRDAVLIVSPELQSSGASSFLQATSSSPSGSMTSRCEPSTVPRLEAVQLVQWQEPMDSSSRPAVLLATPCSFDLKAPTGADADVLSEVVPSDTTAAALVFTTYVGVVHLGARDGSYSFIDLLETQQRTEQTFVQFAANGRAITAAGRGSPFLYAAGLQSMCPPLPTGTAPRGGCLRGLERIDLRRPARQVQAFEGARNELLVLSEGQDPEKSRLATVEVSVSAGGVRLELVEGQELQAYVDTINLVRADEPAMSPLVAAWDGRTHNSTVRVINPQLIDIPGASATRDYVAPAPFTRAAGFDSEHVLLFDELSELPTLQVLSLSDGNVVNLLIPGERLLSEPEALGPYVRLVVESEGAVQLVFVSLDGTRTSPVALAEVPAQILSNTEASRSGFTSPLRMAVVFDNPLGRLSVVGGQPPAFRYSATGYLGTAAWTVRNP